MAAKNETPVLILSLLATVGLLVGGGWWLTQKTPWGQQLLQPLSQPTGPTSQPSSDITQRFSRGERVLLPSDNASAKIAATQQFASGNTAQAVATLEDYLQTHRNDPEAVIYRNNAKIESQQRYTLAVVVPADTSPNPASEILRGVAQLQTEINEAGGLGGILLEILIASDDDNPTIAVQVAQTLVQDSQVLGVVGHFGSSTTLAAAQIYQDGGLVMISPTSTSIRLSGFGSYIFRTVPSDRFTATALSRYLTTQFQAPKVAVYFNANSDYSQSLKEEFTTALYTDGGAVVAEVNLADAGFNSSSSLSNAQQQGATAIALLNNTATLDQALQIVTQNQQRLPIVGGDSLYNPKLLQVGQGSAEGMVVAVPWILLTQPNSPFVTQAQKLWGGDINWRTAMAYDATLALTQGLRQNPTRAGLQATLTNAQFSVTGASGNLKFLPSGDRNQAMQLVVVEPGKRSGFGYDFIPEASSP